jgi:hypothetical protein
MSTIIPKLELVSIIDAKLEEYALDKVAKINDAGSVYSGINPGTAEVEGKAEEFKDALVAADDGTKADTEAKDDLRKELEAMLTLQAQNCAEIAAGNKEIFLKSGYELKDVKPGPVGELEAPDMHKLKSTQNIGELKANWSPVEHKQNYTIRAYTDSTDPEGSLIKEEIVSPSNAHIQGLTSGAQVYVDVRANGGSTKHGPWSEAMWARPR